MSPFPTTLADRALMLAARAAPALVLLLLGLPVAAGLLFTLLPAFGVLPALGGAELSLRPFRDLFAQSGIWRSAALSLWTGLAASLLSLGLAMLVLAAFAGTRIFSRLQVLLAPLLALPHAAAAFGLAFLFAPSGWLARLVSPGLSGWQAPPDILFPNDSLGIALVLGLALKELPFLLLVAGAALPQAQAGPRSLVAASLGYGRMAGFLFTVWPALYPQMRLAVLAVVAFSTSVVDVAAILGPTLPPVLAVRLVQWMNDPDLARRFPASAGAVLQLGVSLAALLVWAGLERLGAALRARLAGAGLRFSRDRPARLLAGGFAALAGGGLTAGAASLLVWSFAGLWPFPLALPETLTLGTWQRALPGLGSPLRDTLLVGACAATAALLLVVLSLVRAGETTRHPAYGERPAARLGGLIYLPLLLPQAAFLFGLQLVFLLLGLNAARPALVLAHLVFVLPYVMLALSGPWAGFDRRFEQTAAGLGHGAARSLFSVRLPMLSAALAGAWAIGFAVSAGLYLPTVLIGAGRITTVTTEAVALASGANRRLIGAYAFTQMALPFAGFAVALLLPSLIWRGRRGLRL